jgi:hypothetical protein
MSKLQGNNGLNKEKMAIQSEFLNNHPPASSETIETAYNHRIIDLFFE